MDPSRETRSTRTPDASGKNNFVSTAALALPEQEPAQIAKSSRPWRIKSAGEPNYLNISARAWGNYLNADT